MKKRLPSTFYNPLSSLGFVVFLVNIVLILFLALVQAFLKRPSPYADLVIFILLPFISLCGLALVIIGVVRERRRLKAGRTEERRFPVIDLNDPRRRKSLYVFGGGLLILSLLYAFAGYKAYEYAESNAFCGSCHVNRPEYISHRFSPHAQIGCVECHIGSGAKYTLLAKMNGTLELVKYVFDKYPRPLHTPIGNLRPSREICETCHGPKYQLDEKLISKTHFLSDAQNTPWRLNLLLRKGTGPVETAKPSRMHWHDTVAKEIQYIAADPKRTVIPWVRVTRLDGTVRVYRSPEGKLSEKDLEKGEKRLMDCMDCHNRDGHFFRPPDQSLSAYLRVKAIDSSLPEIKRIGMKALEGNYGSKSEGAEGIRKTVTDFYSQKYPEVASSKKTQIEKAVTELQNIYGRNYDPAMKASWKSFPDNAGHMYSLGCFRCHDNRHVSDDGKVLSRNCGACHILFTQQVEAQAGRVTLSLASSAHPINLGGSYQGMDCSECHGPGESGQKRMEITKTAADPRYAGGSHLKKLLECSACHGKTVISDDSETRLNQKCVGCHGSLADIAAKKKGHINPHQSHLGEINCTACHSGHEPSRVYCLNCHSFDIKIPGSVPSQKVADLAKVAPLPTEEEIKGFPREKADVAVIGAGGAGFTAAITAHDLGVKVILLEKMPATGGNTMLSAGGMNAAETPFQKKKGIKDSVDIMIDDTMKGGGKVNDPELVKILAAHSAGSIEWLTQIGADMSDVGRMGGASVSRTHRPSGGAAVGAHLAEVLKKNAAQRRIDVRVNSQVLKILSDSTGRVTGVLVRGKHQGDYIIEAKAVVNTAGGFSANPEMVAKYRPEYKGMTTSNQPGARGEGMDLGAGIGGKLVDMKEIQIHPTVAKGSRILITEAVRGNGAILVNREGKRFINEITTRDKASAAILQQKGESAFMIFDEGIRKSLKQIDGYFHLELVKEGKTPEELAAKIGVPADAFKATLEAYNKAVETKNDGEFKRPDMPRPVKTPKFYAIEIAPGIHYTMGGLKINPETQVINQEGKPIPGFFAAGEVTGGVHGTNRLGGNSISETITFGRIAGANAAKLAKQ
jgi:fumarate reductase flavoprotein subunit